MRYPGAQWRPLPNRSDREGMRAHNVLCVHTAVGYLAGTEDYFSRTQIDSHFGVGNPTDGVNDGAVWQWIDTNIQSHANLNGNHEVISVETADGGNPNNPWSPKALDALVNLGVWVCKTHNIPPRLIDGNEPGSRGIAYHRQGCDHSSSYRPRGWPYDQWRVSGGVKWSSSLGKSCPGDVRIKQLVDVVIPRIKAGVEGEEMSEQIVRAALMGAFAEAASRETAYGRQLGTALKEALVKAGLAAAVADAVVAKLGTGTDGSITRDDVKAAVAEVLRSVPLGGAA